jgi:hypothetical protein
LNESEIFCAASLFLIGSADLLIDSAAFLIFSEVSFANSVSAAFFQDSFTEEPTFSAALLSFSEACFKRSD